MCQISPENYPEAEFLLMLLVRGGHGYGDGYSERQYRLQILRRCRDAPVSRRLFASCTCSMQPTTKTEFRHKWKSNHTDLSWEKDIYSGR